MEYRHEIDGLRAVAVLPVILFHAGFSAFGGGFVGVDVFFVISGYLITRILLQELAGGTFSIIRFYERRARRILPALFFVILACVPFAYLLMPPAQLIAFGKSIVAVVAFVSNIQFWREADYFAATAEFKPLLHTWSLAVEEQFYLFFPLFLMALRKFGRRAMFWGVVTIAISSLIAAEWGARSSLSANFYLAHSRAWELLVGGLCAFLATGKGVRANNWLSALGFALILFAIFTYDEKLPYPSLYTLVPVGGAGLVILFAGQETLTGWFLGRRLFVFIGLISYSAYLWHQPLFAFARLGSLTSPSDTLMVVLALASILFGWATWRYVEQPFRHGTKPFLSKPRNLFTAGVLAASFLATLGLALQDANGFPSRLHLSKDLRGDLYKRELRKECFDLNPDDLANSKDWFCETGTTEGFSHTIAVIGDSHALSFFGPISRFAKERSIRVLLSGISGCVPFADTFVRWDDERRDSCANRNANVFLPAALQDVDLVILISRWSVYGFGDTTGVIRQIGSSHDVSFDNNLPYQTFKQQYNATLARLSELQIPVIVLHQAPLQDADVVRILLRAAIFGITPASISKTVSLSAILHDERYGELQREMINIAKDVPELQVEFVDIAKSICDPLCQIIRDGRAVYYNDDHISNFGAQMVMPALGATIEGTLDREINYRTKLNRDVK